MSVLNATDRYGIGKKYYNILDKKLVAFPIRSELILYGRKRIPDLIKIKINPIDFFPMVPFRYTIRQIVRQALQVTSQDIKDTVVYDYNIF